MGFIKKRNLTLHKILMDKSDLMSCSYLQVGDTEDAEMRRRTGVTTERLGRGQMETQRLR